MKNIKEFIINNGTVVDGPINEPIMDELFEETENKIFFIPFVKIKKSGKLIKGGVVEAISLAQGKYSTLYRIISITYPNGLKDNMKLDINKDDIFSEKKFYTHFKKIEKAIEEFDGHIIDEENSFKFKPLSSIEIANNWYKSLSKNEKSFVEILRKSNNI